MTDGEQLVYNAVLAPVGVRHSAAFRAALPTAAPFIMTGPTSTKFWSVVTPFTPVFNPKEASPSSGADTGESVASNYSPGIKGGFISAAP